ncbi:arginine--tRNA ligase [soil metagenome]
MQNLKTSLQTALNAALDKLGVADADAPIQEVPAGKPGDYGSPVAFTVAKTLRKNPALIAQDLVASLELPPGIAKAEAVGPYLNFFVEPGAFVRGVLENDLSLPAHNKKMIVEHTSVNPNKEAHVGHLRNIVLGDACARILRAAGFEVEVQNYIDDTGRQAAESIFAARYFNAEYEGSKKYDHWLGELYVRLTSAKESDGEAIEAGVSDVMHRLERGELRTNVEDILRAQLQTYYRLGAEYDVFVWESDIVRSGLLEQALAVLNNSDHVFQATDGKYAGALVMDVSEFLPGLEEPLVVLVRSDGNAMYVMKDIPYQYWKVGLFEGLEFTRFDIQPSGKTLYTSAPQGEAHPDGRVFAHADEIVNVIDARQSHMQTIVKPALKLSDTAKGYDQSHHLAYEVVTLEGEAMSGRKGVTLSIDAVMAEAVKRARNVVAEKNAGLATIDEVAEQVGIGALRFGMVKSEAKRIIDFRWEQALSLQGDSAPYVQYAHARACSILRAAKAEDLSAAGADFSKLGDLEVKLAQTIARLPETVSQAARDFAPHVVAQYCLDLATAWNGYYNHKDASGKPDTRVLQSEPGLREARLALVEKVKETLRQGLELLGIGAPEEM